MAKKTDKGDGAPRRDFLKLASLGGIAGAAAAIAGKPEAAEAHQQPAGSGYRVTEHVKKAYALAKF